MSYQEKRAIVAAASAILITAIYFALAAQQYPDADPYSREVFRFWGTAILILLPVSIVARIGVYIVFIILNYVATREEDPGFADERDRLIELKANRNALYVVSLSFVLAMAAIALEAPPAVMFAILIVGGVLSDILSELSQVYYYRRGV